MDPKAPIDYASVAQLLKALSYATRLELLDALRFPRMVGELRVSPQRLDEGDNPDRPATRQTLQAHVDRLVVAGLVQEETFQVGERTMRRYVVNPQKLYVVTEELRRLSTRHAGHGADVDGTQSLKVPATNGSAPRGPRLVLVHGVYEGKAFYLDPAFAEDGVWKIGRKRGLAVSLDYDPFVSSENSAIAGADGHFTVSDLATSRNGTSVNWQALPKDLARPLNPGDVIGVGRSLLVFVPK